MKMGIISWPIFWLLTLLQLQLITSEFIPKVVETKASTIVFLKPFDDSQSILKVEGNQLTITHDNGNTWEPIKDIDGAIAWAAIDSSFSHDRAFAISEYYDKFYVTDDQGFSWKSYKLNIPGVDKDPEYAHCYINTHPTDKNYMLLQCTVCTAKSNEDLKRDILAKQSLSDLVKIYGTKGHTKRECRLYSLLSKNGGKSFSVIDPPYERKENKGDDNDVNDGSSLISGTECKFVKRTKDSEIETDGVSLICMYEDGVDPNDRNEKDPASYSNSRVTRMFLYKNAKTFQKLDLFDDMMINDFEVLNSYVLVLTQDDKYNVYSPKKVWVSRDAENFQSAYIPTQIRFNRIQFEIYEDYLGRIILPVQRVELVQDGDFQDGDDDSGRSHGHHGGHHHNNAHKLVNSEILVSDSTGLKFSILNWGQASVSGFTALERANNIEGVMLGTFMPMGGDLRDLGSFDFGPGTTKITLDGGIHWQNLKVVDPDNKASYKCDISDSESCSILSIFPGTGVRIPTAGIMMISGVVSNDGHYNFEDQRTFISRDGGATWKMALDFPTLFATGDGGNIMVAIPFDPESDEDPQTEFYYSLDQGETWAEYQLDQPLIVTDIINTTPDGSGSNFMLSAFTFSSESMKFGSIGEYFYYTIDFAEAFDGATCKDSDMETMYLNGGNPVNGAKYSYKRRKLDSQCLVRKVYENLSPESEPIEACTTDDYECSFEFSRGKDGSCVLDSQLLSLSGACDGKQKGNKEISLKPMQKIKNNKCKKGMSIDDVKVPCSSVTEPAKSEGKIAVTENMIKGEARFYQYFDTNVDESFIIGTANYDAYISHDGGQTIQQIDTDGEKVMEIVFNPFFNSSAYIFTAAGNLFITNDRGYTFSKTELPESLQLGFPLDFHAKDMNSFIYYGGKGCDESLFSPSCQAMAYITRDGGKTFNELLDHAIHCEFAGSSYEFPSDENMIICQQRDKETERRQLISSVDEFKNDKRVIFDNIIGFMSSGKFSIVAVAYGQDELRAYVTMDGSEFAEAKLPKELEGIQQEVFTVLDTKSGSIFLHFTTNPSPDAAFGDLIKSNSNGTSFVTLQQYVNNNLLGQADYENIQGLEGIILINVVENGEKLKAGKETEKKLKTKITFNDGSDWTYLKPPTKDSQGKKYKCESKSLRKCSLNLHGYTERVDIRDTYSSGSALGMMIGVGNVGEYLLPMDECSTFLTVDGGSTWKEVANGRYQWEYGDHGGILVLVPDGRPTNTLKYSLDAGKTWDDYTFTEEEVLVTDILTVPQDTALRFLLISRSTSVMGDSTRLFTIDFSGSFDRQCNLNMDDKSQKDFEYSVLIPSQTGCHFGHEEEYLKKINNKCFVGNVPLSLFSRITRNCSCTRLDFECDYNYYKDKDGTCKLVKALMPEHASDVCLKDPNLIEYSDPTGYRKIPLSTCRGGLTLDISAEKFACPGKEKEFMEKYKIKGRPFLLMFFVPFILISGLLWFIYDRGIRRNGGFSRFGEIRLDDDDLIENNNVDKAVNSVVKAGLLLASALYAGYQLAKRGAGNLLHRYFRRFSPRRGPSYSTLMHDQFLDEADDILTGHDEDANDLSSFLDSESNFDMDDENHHPYSDNTVDEEPAHEPEEGDSLLAEDRDSDQAMPASNA